MKTSDICTNIAEAEDKDILTRPLFAVNIRLMRTSPGYRRLVEAACEYIAECCRNEDPPGCGSYIGFSGANAGIPWDIIAVKRNGRVEVMINAQCNPAEGSVRVANWEGCGSMPDAGPMIVERDSLINVGFYRPDGTRVDIAGVYGRGGAGFVIQHEVDHNDGILLTERRIE